MTPTYEYKSVLLPTQNPPEGTLNALALEGWDVAATTPVGTVLLESGAHVTRMQYLLKRPLPGTKKAKAKK